MSGIGRRRIRSLPKVLLVSLIVGFGLAGCAAPKEQAQTSYGDTDEVDAQAFGTLLQELKRNPRTRNAAEGFCAAVLAVENDPAHEPFFASFFDVPEDQASLTLCRTLMEAVISDDFSEEELRRIGSLEGSDDFVLFGEVLRKLLSAQERLDSQQVTRPVVTTAEASHSPPRPVQRP